MNETYSPSGSKSLLRFDSSSTSLLMAVLIASSSMELSDVSDTLELEREDENDDRDNLLEHRLDKWRDLTISII